MRTEGSHPGQIQRRPRDEEGLRMAIPAASGIFQFTSNIMPPEASWPAYQFIFPFLVLLAVPLPVFLQQSPPCPFQEPKNVCMATHLKFL